MSLIFLLGTLLSFQAGANGTAAEETPILDRVGQPVSFDALVEELARRDVVFLGEDHDNPTGHRLQLKILEALHRRRPDIILSLEMFERDTQGVLDDYLRGRIDEKEFLKHSRPWSTYKTFYRPLVEFAKTNTLDVVAANVPRRIAADASKGKTLIQADRLFVPRETTSPKDAYYERFFEIMSGHGGTLEDGAMERFYRSQCLKDDAMAEAITDGLAQKPHRRPLVVHLCGKFHSDYGQGTALRVLTRRPLLQVGIVTMEPTADVLKFDPKEHLGRAHFLLVVPEVKKKTPSKESSEKTVPTTEKKPAKKS
jgi:uncharacterized iron-regulated protein